MLYNAPIGAGWDLARLIECRLTRTANLDKQTIPPPPNASGDWKGTRSVATAAARRFLGGGNERGPFWRRRRLDPLWARNERADGERNRRQINELHN